jgi:hypothetical protein
MWGPDEPGHALTRVLSFDSPSGRRDQMTAFIGRAAARLSSRAAFVCALVLRQNNTQHLLRGPKGPVRIQSEEETIY